MPRANGFIGFIGFFNQHALRETPRSAFFVSALDDDRAKVIVITKVDIGGFGVFGGIEIEILIDRITAFAAIGLRRRLGLLKRRRLLGFQDRLRHPGKATGNASDGLILRQIIETRIALRAGTLGAPFSLDHYYLRNRGKRQQNRRFLSSRKDWRIATRRRRCQSPAP
jgi:hypothetical protein